MASAMRSKRPGAAPRINYFEVALHESEDDAFDDDADSSGSDDGKESSDDDELTKDGAQQVKKRKETIRSGISRRAPLRGPAAKVSDELCSDAAMHLRPLPDDFEWVPGPVRDT